MNICHKYIYEILLKITKNEVIHKITFSIHEMYPYVHEMKEELNKKLSGILLLDSEKTFIFEKLFELAEKNRLTEEDMETYNKSIFQ